MIEEKETTENDAQTEDTGKAEISGKRGHGFATGVLTGALAFGVLAGVLLIAGIKTGKISVASADQEESAVSETASQKLAALKGLISLNYYEDVDTEQLEEGLYAGLIEALDDPYSAYYTPEEYEDLMTTTTRQYYGIGAGLSQDPDTMVVTVSYVYEDTPAEEAGLEIGDIIVAVDDVDVSAMDVDDIVNLIHGDEGTKVKLTLVREGEADYLEKELTRATVNLPSVEYAMLDGNIGYIYITKFATATAQEFEEAEADLKAQGMQAMIIDVRYNGGGLLTSVVQILDDILPEGIVVYTEDKYGNREDQLSSGDTYMDYPIAVLVNGSSASASEILAGAIRDYEYGTIIGTTTYGKGCVQKTYELTDGSAVKLTVEKYFTPSGENIQDTGIEPDVELEYEFLGTEEQEYDRSLDNQILKAVEVLEQELEQ